MERLLAATLHRALEYAKKNPRLRSILYRTRNRRVFSDLLEHELMLADQVRVDAYREAIRRDISEQDVVVDLGTGTGILAFFASQQRAKRIYAIDHGDVISLAKFLAEQNGFNDIIFKQVHSRDFTPPEKIDVILHEQLGALFFDEDMLTNICELRDRVLAPNGRIIPDKFDVFLEPLCLKDERRVPFLWEHQLHGVRFDTLKDRVVSNSAGPKSRAHRMIWPEDAAYFLCDPEEVLSLDLSTARPDSVPRKLNFRKTLVRAGAIDGFCMYFRIRFDHDLSIDNSPFSRRTSWFCHLFRVERAFLDKGDLLDVEWEMGEQTDVKTWRISYRRVERQASSSLAAE